MAQELEETIAQRLAELPEDVRTAIESADVESRIQEIGRAHNLHINQIGTLQDETLLVMLGFSDPAEFPDTLQKRLTISAEDASLIADNIGKEVFEAIRDSMKNFMEKQAVAPASSVPPAVQSALTAVPRQARTIMPTGGLGTAQTPLMHPVVDHQNPSQKPPVTAPVAKVEPTRLPTLSEPHLPARIAEARPAAVSGGVPMPAAPQPATAPGTPLHAVEEKLSATTVSAAKPFDLSLKTNGGKPAANNTPSQPPAKTYAKDPYREPVE